MLNISQINHLFVPQKRKIYTKLYFFPLIYIKFVKNTEGPYIDKTETMWYNLLISKM